MPFATLLRFPRLRLRNLLLSPPLYGFGTALRIHKLIPPPKRAGVVPDELLMVDIVVVRTSPIRKEMVQTEREIVARMRVNSLEQPEHDPCVHGQDMEIAGDSAIQDRPADCSES